MKETFIQLASKTQGIIIRCIDSEFIRIEFMQNARVSNFNVTLQFSCQLFSFSVSAMRNNRFFTKRNIIAFSALYRFIMPYSENISDSLND